ncbi:hypothetical protein Rsub_11332 [Raphidocelis subcapitata]|uniref:O-fucosyltransferase family protein n=1 Tax=Raphidocelis subcapitata TaxID=307507 RepID=A0A2V0PD89_9CHLO|nr:hypothetical protein Rsub_11332 [Raphidocelis subcapitata]|eukprot:GBF97806.1 hypothetical protein Rsub_11332 [Raphidocelis subcapitata]
MGERGGHYASAFHPPQSLAGGPGSKPPGRRRRAGAGARGAPPAAALLLAALLAAAWLLWRWGGGGTGRAGAGAAPQMACEDRPARGAVYLNYEVIFGLCNQMISHLNAVTLALAAGLDGVILPPAWSRPHFNHSVDEDVWNKNTPIATLLDIAEMRRRLAPAGIDVLESTEDDALVMRHTCEQAAQSFSPLESIPNAVWRVRSLVDSIRMRRPANQRCIHFQRYMLFWAHDLTSGANLPYLAAQSLAFNSTVEALAEEVAAAIGGAFNGAHMRIELDMGLKAEKAMPQYITHMRRLGFNASAPLYAASGLLTYNDTGAFRRMEEALKSAGVCSRVLSKEFLVGPERLAGLHSEQLALVDLLVLTRSARFVGHKASTFSYFARDLRALRGGGDLTTAGLLEGGKTWESGTVIAPHD